MAKLSKDAKERIIISLTSDPVGREVIKAIEEDGSGVLSGNGAPDNSLGENGNLYVNLLTGDFYVKHSDSWELQAGGGGGVVSVNGETGIVVLDKTDIGLGNVDNTSDLDKPISSDTQAALDLITNVTWTGDYNNGTTYTVGQGVMFNGASFRMIVAIGAAGYSPVAYPANWLQVTDYVSPNDIGLGNVDNTSDADKPISSATQAALDDKLDASQVGVPNGAASLDGTGKVPSAQLPSYVDDVVEYANLAAFPAIGETNKIYVALDTNKCYRWSGSTYIEISPSEVNSVNGQVGIVVLDKSDIGLSDVDNTSDADKPISDDTQAALDDKVAKAGDTMTGQLVLQDSSILVDYTITEEIPTTIQIEGDSILSTVVDGDITTISNVTSKSHTITRTDASTSTSDKTIQLGANDSNNVLSATIVSTTGNTNSYINIEETGIYLQYANNTTGVGENGTYAPGVFIVQTILSNNTTISITGDQTGLSLTTNDGVDTTPLPPTQPEHVTTKKYVDDEVATKEDAITAGTTSQYYRGDKTFQTLDKSAVGLSNVDNTSDANKPISTATQTALDLITDVNWTGDYNNGVTYTVGDGVMFNGASFRMIIAIGAAGYNPVAYPANWLQVTDYVSANDIGLDQVDNTSDLDKPISDDTQDALDLKADANHVHDLSVLTQSGASVGEVPSWDGSAWVPSTVPSLIPTVTADRALISDSSGHVAASSVTSTTLEYLDATSSVQTQLDTKIDNEQSIINSLIFG